MRRLLPILALAGPLLAAGSIHAQPSPEGAWAVALEAPDGTVVRFVLEVRRDEDGAWGATARRTDPERELSIEQWTLADGTIVFSIPELPGAPRFSGSVLETEIVGEVSLEPPPPPPSTDIYLFELSRGANGRVVGRSTRVTDRQGYDNQPSFVPGGGSLLYTSIRGEQADVYRYDLATGESTALTETAESEYSPTPLPSGDGFSTVRVEADGTQRLWSFDLQGRAPVLLLEGIAPVGYHTWIDGHRLGLFVLGSPPELRLAELGTGRHRQLGAAIGRSLHPAPQGGAVTFVDKTDDSWTIELLEVDSGRRATLIETLPEREDFAWTPDGTLLMGDGSNLYTAQPFHDDPQWRWVADLGSHGVTDISRLAVSDDGSRLALVSARAAAGARERISRPFRMVRIADD